MEFAPCDHPMENSTENNAACTTNEFNHTETLLTSSKMFTSPIDESPPYQVYKMKQIPTIFGQIHEKNVTFCIDTSGSMYNALNAVKEHLVEALMQQAQTDSESMFNLIEFSTEVTQWSDKMVRCTPQTVAVATEWVQKLEAKTGTNTMDALLTAFTDPVCEAVCLVTDGHPDQHPTDILDRIAYVSQNRPVHAYLIQTSDPDPAASEFLQDLSMETYGSFHVISVTQHGSVERITPIYRAEATAERIVRTTDGNIYPSNHKVCSVATTLISPLPEVVIEQPAAAAFLPYAPPMYPYHHYPWPYRYYYQYQHPHVGWSRYRPARASLHDPMPPPEDYVPGAGAMLIGTSVLARRNTDGFFYVGTVKSQILSNKFLVEFGPCKHGKYKDTSYQETYVHDIVSQADALRHSVVVGDKVLAPWEPEGERYGPGVVIDGQEKRIAQGGGPDQTIVVAFHNGKSATVPKDTTIWIPYELHERITFELRLPKKVRCEFAEKEKPYPEESLPGYPTSGPRVNPEEFDIHEAGWVHRTRPALPYYRYNPFYIPMQSVYYKQQPKQSDIRSEEISGVVPGTDLTKSELNEKVMSQLMKYKIVLEGKKDLKEVENSKLLRKRDTLEENTITRPLEKSVTFKDPDSDLEPEVGDLEMRDSGRGSQTDIDLEGFSDLELEDYADEETEANRDTAAGTDAGLMYRKVPRRTKHKPSWRYWSSDPAPSLLEPMHAGPYRLGPYEESVTHIPSDNRVVFNTENEGGWSTSMTDYVDYLSKYKPGASVGDSLHMPKPPDYKPEKQGPGRSVSETLHGNMSEADQLAVMRHEFRRKHALKREDVVQEKYEEGERMKSLMLDQHRQKVDAQLERDRQRYIDEAEKVRLLREAKKEINEQLRSRIDENQSREMSRDGQRVEALRAKRERREDIRRQREQEITHIKSERQAAREANVQIRTEAIAKNLAVQESQEATRNQQAHAAKQRRYQQFYAREAGNQQLKQLAVEAQDNKSAVFRSRIFP